MVAALCCNFDVPEVLGVPPSDTRIVLVQLQWAIPSVSGQISLEVPGASHKRLASGILAVVNGNKMYDQVQTQDNFAIKSYVQEA